MAKSKSSKRWISEHEGDRYVQKARADGYRSRAAYKLMELNRDGRLIRPGMVVVDLGAAPGGWSQVAMEYVGDAGQLMASDILDMDPLPGVQFIQGDFTEELVLTQILDLIDGRGVDLVISDMAPNISGVKAIDQPRAMYLVELVLDFAAEVLKPGGGCLCKVFQGEGYDQLYREVKRDFARVSTKKPQASRSRSTEMYWLAQGYRGTSGEAQNR